MIPCWMCGKEFEPDSEKLREWAESGRNFDPTDWECSSCSSFPNANCRWSPVWDGNTWRGACGNKVFQFEDGGPTENGFTHCPYCGKPLEVVA